MTDLQLDRPLHFRGPVDLDRSEWLFNQSQSQAGQDLFVIAMTQGRKNGIWLELGSGHPIFGNNTYLLEKRLGWTGISIDITAPDYDIITPFEKYWNQFSKNLGASHAINHTFQTHAVDTDFLESIGYLNYYEKFLLQQHCDIDTIDPMLRNWTTARPNCVFVQTDALKFDYAVVPAVCDYLQIDIHPSIDNLRLLELVLPNHQFGVITFEHDAWNHTEESKQVRTESRCLLKRHGYKLVINDVTVPPGRGHGIANQPINFEDWWIHPQSIHQSVWQHYENLDDSGAPKHYYDLLFAR